jgi:predicted aspartyl protease
LTDSPGLLLKPSGQAYATGAARYLDFRPGRREPLPRVYVEFLPDGAADSFLALLDTGAHYCILSPEVVAEIRDHLADSVGRTELLTPYGTVRGELHIHRIVFIASEGESLAVDATVLVSPDWAGPNFIGYTGCLDRLCMALSPSDNRFLFGSL